MAKSHISTVLVCDPGSVGLSPACPPLFPATGSLVTSALQPFQALFTLVTLPALLSLPQVPVARTALSSERKDLALSPVPHSPCTGLLTKQAADRAPPECVGGVGSKMPALMLVFCPALRSMGVLIWVMGNVIGKLGTEQR